MTTLSIDPGLSGALAFIKDGKLVKLKDMPTTRLCIQDKLEQLDLDAKGKKQFIKSGPNKGKPKMKLRRAAKYEKHLDVMTIMSDCLSVDHVIIEKQNPRPGNSAGASFTTGVNYGKLLAAINISRISYTEVIPSVWKTAMHITMSKDEKAALRNDMKIIKETLKGKAISLARHLSTEDFLSERGKLMHDHAEAFLIGEWWHKHHKGK